MGRSICRTTIVEDDPVYRESLEAFVRHAPELELVASHASAEEALSDLEQLPEHRRWDLVLLDLDLPGLHGLEAIPRFKELSPETTVVVLTVFETPPTVLRAITAGADGYLLKRSTARELLHALRAVLAGGAPLTSGVARTILELLRRSEKGGGLPSEELPSRLGLTDRELDVLRCFVDGRSYGETAGVLGVGIDTVRTHVRSIYRKLRVHSVAQAVAVAIRRGLA